MTYASQVASDASLLAHFRLGEASGTTMVDASGNALSGAYAGTVTLGAAGLLTGDADTALSLAGGGVGDSALSTIWNASALTVVAWIKTSDGGVDLIVDRHRASQAKGWQFRLDAGRLDFFLLSGGGILGTRLTTTTTYNDGVRHMVVVTHDPALGSNHTKLFVDGTLVLQANNGNAIPTITGTTGNDIHIGANRSGPGDGIQAGFVGTIDEVSINSVALTSTRITSLYNAGIGSVDPIAIGESESDAVVSAVVSTPNTVAADSESDAVAHGFISMSTARNRVGGRRRLAEAVAVWTPDIVPAPTHVVMAEAYDVATVFGPVTMDGAQPKYVTVEAKTPRADYRIIVGSTDVTYFRGIVTPHPTYQLVEPLLYGAATLSFPQIAPPLEHIGTGALSWLKPGKRVEIQRVLDGEVVDTDYIGIVIGLDVSGSKLTVQVGGEASGRAALMNRQLPIFNGTADIGRYAYGLLKDLGLPFTPHLGPTTGIALAKFGGMSMLDYANELCARGWTRDGNQWSIMPDAPADGGRYRMARKDTTTVHGSVYLDATRVVGNLRRDIAEEPNRIFVTGVTPEGMRVRNGVYPGLVQGPAPRYPMDDNSSFGAGTVDADTDTGDGVSVMLNRLQVTGYLSQRDNPGGYDADVTRAIRALQDDASDGPSFVTGDMDPDTWNALFDIGVTGYSLNWSHIEPMAEDPRVRPWRRSSSGAVIARNPRYQQDRIKVDVNIDMGAGFKRDQMREWANAELDLSDDENWVGTIRFGSGALYRGLSIVGLGITEAQVMPAKELRPGMNLWAPQFNGGTMFHVSGIGVDQDGVVEAMVDTRARDALKVWQIIARNREARSNPARLWLQEHRASTTLHDSITEWDEFGGRISEITLPGGKWTVFPVVAGQEGTVRKLVLSTTPATEFVTAVFGKPIWASRLQRLVGNPLTKHGSRRWNREDVLNALDDQNILLYVAGDNDNPCGYFPKQKVAEGDESIDGTFAEAAPLTGRWEDEAGFSYHTFADPVLYVAVFPSADTVLPAGRIMWNQQVVAA